MPTLIDGPIVIADASHPPIRIAEFVGRVSTKQDHVSIARLTSPREWREPSQRPEFEEITVVLRGLLRVEHEMGTIDVRTGQTIITRPNEWVRYSTPEGEGADYVAVCLPAFSLQMAHRDQDNFRPRDLGVAHNPRKDLMPTLIEKPVVVEAAGNLPKRIEEFVGRVSTAHNQVSVARMTSPPGWQEPGQRPEFEETTVVLRGLLRVEHERGTIDVRAGQAIVARPHEWVRYSTPEPEGAEYVAICLPAFTPQTVHRDA